MTYFKLFILSLIAISSCNNKEKPLIGIKPFSILNDTTLTLNGEITSSTLKTFNKAMEQNPGTTLLQFRLAPGSSDDEINLQVGRKLYQLGLNTEVEENGEIAYGAVDLFLAGHKRVLGKNSRVGVHSWADEKKEANDYPRNSDEHQFFIRYYKDIGMSQQEAEDLYFFTIDAASADNIHWMTDQEVELYSIENDSQ